MARSFDQPFSGEPVQRVPDRSDACAELVRESGWLEALAGTERALSQLSAHDALAAGADQREIAAVLLSIDAAEPRWRNRSPSLRSQVQRLVRGARRMGSGGYVELLQ